MNFLESSPTDRPHRRRLCASADVIVRIQFALVKRARLNNVTDSWLNQSETISIVKVNHIHGLVFAVTAHSWPLNGLILLKFYSLCQSQWQQMEYSWQCRLQRSRR